MKGHYGFAGLVIASGILNLAGILVFGLGNNFEPSARTVSQSAFVLVAGHLAGREIKKK